MAESSPISRLSQAILPSVGSGMLAKVTPRGCDVALLSSPSDRGGSAMSRAVLPRWLEAPSDADAAFEGDARAGRRGAAARGALGLEGRAAAAIRTIADGPL